jgi:hypothetical protein
MGWRLRPSKPLDRSLGISDSAAQTESDLIIIGGYNQHPLFAPRTSLDDLMRITGPLLLPLSDDRSPLQLHAIQYS